MIKIITLLLISIGSYSQGVPPPRFSKDMRVKIDSLAGIYYSKISKCQLRNTGITKFLSDESYSRATLAAAEVNIFKYSFMDSRVGSMKASNKEMVDMFNEKFEGKMPHETYSDDWDAIGRLYYLMDDYERYVFWDTRLNVLNGLLKNMNW